MMLVTNQGKERRELTRDHYSVQYSSFPEEEGRGEEERGGGR